MAKCYSFLILLLVVFLALADADLRIRRSPQFSQASASAGSFGNYPRGFGGPNFGPPRPPAFARGPQFGGRPPLGPPGFGNSGFGRPRPGATINISKSISINAGGRGGGARSSAGRFGASSSAGGFGK